jgi:hypothetical protein
VPGPELADGILRGARTAGALACWMRRPVTARGHAPVPPTRPAPRLAQGPLFWPLAPVPASTRRAGSPPPRTRTWPLNPRHQALAMALIKPPQSLPNRAAVHVAATAIPSTSVGSTPKMLSDHDPMLPLPGPIAVSAPYSLAPKSRFLAGIVATRDDGNTWAAPHQPVAPWSLRTSAPSHCEQLNTHPPRIGPAGYHQNMVKSMMYCSGLSPRPRLGRKHAVRGAVCC